MRAGQDPTQFRMRHIPGTSRTWMASESRRQNMGRQELAELGLRLALREIVNLGACGVQLELVNGHELATRATIDALYDIDPKNPDLGRELVFELGMVVVERSTVGLDPKR